MTPAYDLTGLRHAYQQRNVLAFDNYSITAGQITALVGANGSGKSTLMDILAFITEPTEGSIRFFGDEVDSARIGELRRTIGYVQQKPYLLNTTVFSNVELGLRLRRVDKAVRQRQVNAQLTELGIGHLSERRAHELSGGEVQKVVIARALILAPKVLILDEPFSHLDRSFRREFEALLRSIRAKGDQTLILTTHNQQQAQLLADNVCTLVNGHLMPVSEVNLFSGHIDPDNHLFVTDGLHFHIAESIDAGDHFSIDPNQLVITRHQLTTDRRNSFAGTVQAIRFEEGQMHINVDAGEILHTIISREALSELDINVGDSVWVSFRSSAAKVF